MGPLDIASILLGVGSKVLDKLFPDPAQLAEAKLKLLQSQQSHELDEINVQLSAIIADAKSADPWTSRARPSFMYVIYILILTAIPMGVLSAASPDTASHIISGFHQWLAAIPESYLQLFGVGYLGYVGGRSWEKVKGANDA